MTWQTRSLDRRNGWHWVELPTDGSAICGMRLMHRPPTSTSERVRGGMKVCPCCQRKLAMRASVSA